MILGGAGGVGSATIQLAKRRTAVSVYASASRPDSATWVRQLGADGVIDHHDLVASVRPLVPSGVDYLVSPHSNNIPAFAEIMNPFGQIAAIDEPEGLDLLPLKAKSITWHWELMFTRPMFHTTDLIEQKHLLEQVATMVDAHEYRSPIQVAIDDFTANGLRSAHALVETGRTIGKIVIHR